MKKSFKWGLGSFVVGVLGMLISYKSSFVSADINEQLSKGFNLASIAFTISAILVFVSVILFMVAASVEKK
jgi:hypothetical protein